MAIKSRRDDSGLNSAGEASAMSAEKVPALPPLDSDMLATLSAFDSPSDTLRPARHAVAGVEASPNLLNLDASTAETVPVAASPAFPRKLSDRDALMTLPARRSLVVPKLEDAPASSGELPATVARASADTLGLVSAEIERQLGGSGLAPASAPPAHWDLETREASRPAGSDPDAGFSGRGSGPDFVLTRLIGRGGQGEVWRAWQTSLDREVAVKRLSEEGDPTHFLQEAYASAELDHPNIVPVHDLGRVGGEDGGETPLLAMKMVRGKPWNLLLRQERPGPDQPLDAFWARHILILMDVCNAVAYAHSKGIVHRDLKPHQVMVGDFGEVYLMDWGLAARVGDEVPFVGGLPKFQLLASAPNRCGTPAYMAPEQTTLVTDRVGFHTDIYLLGAILYEIVKGLPPHADTTSAGAFAAAMANHFEPLPPHCPAELRHLAGRALADEPEYRPASVMEFRAELADYLGGSGKRRESVEIANTVEREFREVAAKTRGYEYFLTFELQLNRALQLWPDNRKAAELRLAVFERYAGRALRARDLFLAETLASFLPEGAPRREEMLRRVTALRERKRRGVRHRRQLGAVATGLVLALLVLGAKYALDLYRSEFRARLERDRVERLLGFMLDDVVVELEPLGRARLMEEIATKAQEYYESRTADDLSDQALGQRAAALKSIGDAQLKRGSLERARSAYDEFQRLAESLSARDPGNPRWRRQLAQSRAAQGQVLRIEGNLAGAQAALRDALTIAREEMARRPDDLPWLGAASLYEKSLASMLVDVGELDKASQHLRSALKIQAKLLNREPNAPAWLDQRADTLLAFSDIHRAKGKIDAAQEARTLAAGLYRNLAADSFANASWQSSLSIALNRLGDLLGESRGDWASAAEHYEEALRIRRRLAAFDPENALWKRHLASSLHDRGRVLRMMGRPAEALEALRESLGILDKLVANDQANSRWASNRARSLAETGLASRDLGDWRAAETSLREALLIVDGLVANRESGHAWWKTLQAEIHRDLGDLFEARGRLQEALAERQAAASTLEALAAQSPRDALTQQALADARARLDATRAKLNDEPAP
jgi:serine/threonine protein kinase